MSRKQKKYNTLFVIIRKDTSRRSKLRAILIVGIQKVTISPTRTTAGNLRWKLSRETILIN